MIGDLKPGVFLVFTTEKKRLREALILRDMGNGPNYVLLRPFHLCSMEVPLSVAQAVLQGRRRWPRAATGGGSCRRRQNRSRIPGANWSASAGTPITA